MNRKMMMVFGFVLFSVFLLTACSISQELSAPAELLVKNFPKKVGIYPLQDFDSEKIGSYETTMLRGNDQKGAWWGHEKNNANCVPIGEDTNTALFYAKTGYHWELTSVDNGKDTYCLKIGDE